MPESTGQVYYRCWDSVDKAVANCETDSRIVRTTCTPSGSRDYKESPGNAMAPQVPALAQSESKARFFARLGLDPTNGTHRRVYNLMKMEAAEGRKRLLEGQATSTAQIHESAWQREVLRIYHDAQPQTRAVYQFGHDTADPHAPDNWIIRWMLWHVFRYRDYRNKQQRQMNDTASGDEDDEHSSDLLSPPDSSSSRKGSGSSTAASSVQAEASAPSRPYWDPVRDQ